MTALGILVGALCIVAILNATLPDDRQKRLFWFPDTAGADLHAEWRELPYRATRQDRIAMFLDDLVLGPVELGAIPIVSRNTEVRSIILAADGTLYLDFSKEIAFEDSSSLSNLDDRITLISRNIRHNFRFVEAIIITIEGQLPNEPRFAANGR